MVSKVHTTKWLLSVLVIFLPLVNAQQNSCVFGDKKYRSGQVVNEFCYTMVCNNGQWVFRESIDPSCGHCWLYNDPHIRTFDGYPYDWHGLCNHSLAQTDQSYEPKTAVFASFKTCFESRHGSVSPSCVDKTTFRDNPHTVVGMNAEYPEKIEVNGEHMVINDPHTFTTITTSSGVQPLLAIKNNDCTVVVGYSGFVVMQCRYRVDVWVSKSYLERVGGLCGNFNMQPTDELQKRDGTYVPDSTAFAMSWLTNRRKCFYEDPTYDARCRYPTNEFADLCKRITRGIMYLYESCKYDLCMLYHVEGGEQNMKIWTEMLIRNTIMTQWIAKATQGPME